MVVFNVMGHGESSAREAREKTLVYIYICMCITLLFSGCFAEFMSTGTLVHGKV